MPSTATIFCAELIFLAVSSPILGCDLLCSPHFGIAHALCLGMGPWLAAEVPHLVDTGVIHHKDNVVVRAAT